MKVRNLFHLAMLCSIWLTSCSSLSIVSNTITPTSVPSNTPAPTTTVLPTYTSIPTNTPQPTNTRTSTSSTKLERLIDGSWKYEDKEAGFQFQLGKNWYLEDVSSLSVTEIIDRTLKITDELGLKNTPQYFIEPEGMLVLGVYTDETFPDYMSSAFNASHIIDDGFANMSLEDIQARVIEVLAQTHNRDPKTFDSKLSKNEFGTEYGVVFFNLALNYYQMRIFFKLEDGMGMVTFGFSDKNVDTFGPDWALLTSSLQYTNP